MKNGLLLFIALSTSAFAQINPDLPNPALLTEKYLEEISKREIGQSSFAVKEHRYYMASARGGAPSPAQMEAAPSGENRDIQESDVFKIGKKDKKELFLLNRHRGFQVVSFEDGIEKPKIVGRFPVYNNWNSEMYFLEKENKVLVVNTEWTTSSNRWQTNYSTVLYLIDVTNSSEPKIIEETTVPGLLEQSRMVGDVLYTITNSGNWNEMKAQITSVKLSGNSMSQIDTAELHGKDRWVRTMNVVKEGSRYFVVSTLSNWQNQGDLVNVHDITSSKGDIEKLFTAKARGTISERSQTFFHKNHLFAVSNYQENQQSRMRVSVEAFAIAKTDEIVVSKENMRVSVGDTNGQHASLQDVRVSGDMLYAFWVPANNIDPFDLFDISEPAKGIKHLGQLQFDGWISKAFPLEINDKKFVLGLGWIVPATSENGRRYPQAKLFEIKSSNGSVKHEVVASLTLESADLWASLNDEDKMFEIMQETPGVYNIMFPVTFTKTWKSGAKIVTADLNTGKIEEGASIVADQGWLSRIFVNKEVRAVNSFSDLSLETFDQAHIASKGVAKAVSILELARNIIDFKAISNTVGVQVIEGEKAVELRHVSLANADAEKTDVSESVSIPGKYHWHKIQDGKLFVITSIHKKAQSSGAYSYEYEKFEKAHLTVVDIATSTLSVKKIDISRGENEHFWFNLDATSTEKFDVFTIGQDMFKLNGNVLDKLSVAEDCRYFFDAKNRSVSLNSVGNDIYASNSFEVSLGKPESEVSENGPRGYHGGVSYSMPFVKKLGFNNNTVTCSSSINVPGTPVLVNEKFMVTDQMGGRYFGPRPIHFEYIGGGRGMYPYRSSSKTFSLKFNNEAEVEMVDILDKDITAGLFNDGFITYSSDESRLDMWSLGAEGEFLSKPQFLSYAGTSDSSIITVRTFNKRNFIFMKNEKKVDLYEVAKNKKVTKLAVSSSHDLNEADGSAEFIFAINAIEASPDLSKVFISQGLHGITELTIK